LPCDFEIINWVKFLRPDFEELTEEYLSEKELIKILLKQKFKKVEDIISFLLMNNINPSYEYINNGFYNKQLNFINLLHINEEF